MAFMLKLDIITVVFTAGVVTGLVGGLSFGKILNILGEAFVTNPYMTVFFVTLPIIGLLEGYGLKQRIAELIGKLKAATAGKILSLYMVIRTIAAGGVLLIVWTLNELGVQVTEKEVANAFNLKYTIKDLINLYQKISNLRKVIILALEILYILSGIVSLIATVYSFKDKSLETRLGGGFFWPVLSIVIFAFVIGQFISLGGLVGMGIGAIFINDSLGILRRFKKWKY